jgi:hypothetical protein
MNLAATILALNILHLRRDLMHEDILSPLLGLISDLNNIKEDLSRLFNERKSEMQ